MSHDPKPDPHLEPHLTPDLLHGLDLMVAASPLGYAFLAQPARRFTYVNRALARVAGLPASQILGKSPEEVFGRALTERLTPSVMAALLSPEGQGQVEVEAELPGRPGEPGIFRLHCQAIRDGDGGHTGTWYVIQEVTKERRLESQARDQQGRLQAVMDVVPTGVLVANAEGRLLYANNEAERIWGHSLISAESPSEYTRYELYRADGTRAEPDETALARTLSTRSPHRDGKRILKRPDGVSVTVLASSVPLIDEGGDLTGAVVSFCDVTEIEVLQRRQERLAQIAQAVNSDAKLHDILRMVRDAVVETTGFDRAGLWLYDETSGGLRGSWGTDSDGNAVDQSSEVFPLLPTDDHPFAKVLSGEVLVHRAYEDSPDPNFGPICDGAALALVAHGQVIGMIFVDNIRTNRPVSEATIDALLPFCAQAALAIESARLRQTEREQTVWLKEAVRLTNHRVKNNLQVILALIDTELIDDDPVDRATLERIRRQLRIIGSVHEFLGDATHELDISLGEILERVLGVFESGRQVACRLESDNIVVSTKQATAAALILDELVNHAGQRGAKTVDVFLRSRDGRVTLELIDNGTPLPPGFRVNPNTDRQLGLVERLARWDLQGRVAFANQPEGGVCVSVEFSIAANPSPPGPPRRA